MYVGGHVRPTLEHLNFYCYELLCAELPAELPDVQITLHNLVQRTLNVPSDPVQREMGMAMRFLPGLSPWQTTAHRHEFDSVRGKMTDASTLQFGSGSVSDTGTPCPINGLLVVGLIADELEYLSGALWNCGWDDQVLTTDLVVCEVVLPFRVTRERVAQCPFAKWDPDLFPGVFISVIPRNSGHKNASVLVFETRFIVAGPKTAEHAHALCAFMLFYLERFREDGQPGPPAKRRRAAET